MSIGTQLRQAREAQSLSLDQVAQATHIKVHYLEALEVDNFEKLPSLAQLRGFIRAYGDYLKLNSSELIATLEDNSTIRNAISLPPATTLITPTSTGSEAIFKELGHALQSQRELMGLSLGDVERHTHIRMHYIRALEEGDISHLPSPVQGRGMLSNYAAFLGLNTETILLRFADGLQASLYDRQVARNAPTGQSRGKISRPVPARPSQLKRLFSMDLFVGGFLIIFLLGFSIWGALRISRLHAGTQPSPTAPPVSELLLASPTGGLVNASTLIPSNEITAISTVIAESPVISGTVAARLTPTSAVFGPTPGLANAPVQVYIIGVQRAWMRIMVDGEVAFEGRVVPGSAYSFAGNQRIELLTGDGAGLQVYYNQQDLGLIGAFGEVMEFIFSIEGIQTATPSVRPTSTPVPTSRATPSPTPTGTGLPKTATPTPKS
ncbi:MAG TPA: RodZ domain-containing protein [Anaerolineales bacterium]|nr:RodZ domain-containing protein [Anaerolineales bacterium]